MWCQDVGVGGGKITGLWGVGVVRVMIDDIQRMALPGRLDL